MENASNQYGLLDSEYYALMKIKSQSSFLFNDILDTYYDSGRNLIITKLILNIAQKLNIKSKPQNLLS